MAEIPYFVRYNRVVTLNDTDSLFLDDESSDVPKRIAFSDFKDILPSGGSQDLQGVTDLGNTTTNDVQLIDNAELIFGAGGGVLLDNSSRLREGTIDAGLGGSKGVAQICGVGYELKWEAGRLYVMNGSGDAIRWSLYNFNTVPTITDDSTKGYYVGSLWGLDNGDIYECTDATIGAAVWVLKNVGGSLPVGGTAGQILTKVDATDYNATWQENYADWTSVVKHTVKNDGTGLITKGTAVYVTGANGTNILVGKASNTSEATSSKTMGLMQSNITTTGGTQTGFVITEGLLGGLNTAGQTAGDPVWLGVNGALIYGLANKPYAPDHLVFIGIVTKVSAGSGEIFVKVQNGFELKEIHDVDLITNAPTNNQGLIYETSSSLWKNKTIDKTLVGLGNVDNTSDVNKPVSTATQTALNNINSQYTGFLIQNSLTNTTQFAPYAFGGLFATATQAANRLYIAPFILKEDIITNKLSTEVTTLGVLASFYIGVYELDANYFPTGAPVISSTALSGTTIGLKTYTLGSPYTLVKNKWYGMAILSNVNIGTRALPSINYLGTQVTSSVNNNTMIRDITAGFTALPTGASMTALSNVPIGVYLQKA